MLTTHASSRANRRHTSYQATAPQRPPHPRPLLNLTWNHLKGGAALPPSQVILTVPRGGPSGAAPDLTTANLPAISMSPGSDAIQVGAGAVNVPK
ncbi:3HB-oligomer hydrolase (3HBOH) [Paraburkholderia hospita]|nr:3HB-oligomer hydrolase (3HBOH) [Paraburkholderia hospita]